MIEITAQVVGSGPRGEVGPQGYSPIKGTDYFTDSEITEILAPVNSQLADITHSPDVYGAVGNGINDDTVHFQNALDNAPDGGIVDLLGKTYAITGVTISKKTTLRNGNVVLLLAATKSAIEVASTASGSIISNVNTLIVRNGLTATNASGIFVNQAENVTIKNCSADGSVNYDYGAPYCHSSIFGYKAHGIKIIDCVAENAHKEGIITQETDNVILINCSGYNCGNSAVGTSQGVGLYAENCYGENSGASGVTFNSQDSVIINPKSKNNVSMNGITVGHNTTGALAENCTIINPIVDGSPIHGLCVTGSKNCTIIGGSFKNITGDAIKISPDITVEGTVQISNVRVLEAVGEHGISVTCGGAPGVTDVVIAGFNIKNCAGRGINVFSNGITQISDGIIKNVGIGIQVSGTHVGNARSGTMVMAGIKDVDISYTQKSSVVLYNVSSASISAQHRNINLLNDVDSHVIKTYGTIPDDTAKLPLPNPFIISNNSASAISTVSKFANIADCTFDAIVKQLVLKNNNLVGITADRILSYITTQYVLKTSDQKYAKIYLLNTSQTLENNVATKVAFNAMSKDTDLMSDVSNNALICKTPGYYNITGFVNFTANATGLRSLSIYKNGASITTAGIVVATGVNALNFTFITDLTVGDIITLYATQTSGGQLVIQAASGPTRTQLVMYRLAD